MYFNPDRYFAHKKDWFVLSIFAGSFLVFKIILLSILALVSKFVDLSYIIENDLDNNRFKDDSVVFYGIIIAPVLETLIFQYLIIKGLLYIQLVKRYPHIAVLVSAVLFSLVHARPHNVILAGIVLAYNFYYFNKKRSGSFAYWSTVFLHSFYNLVTYLLGYKYISVWL